MNPAIDAVAEIITWLNQRDFASDAAPHPLYSRLGRINARYRQFTLDSHFQPIVALADERVVAHEALLRILAPPASASERAFTPDALFTPDLDDRKIIWLDRLARTLHALNFLLQNAASLDEAGALYLNVHPQHLLAVDGDHGKIFENILQQCGLAPARIVLEVTGHDIAARQRLCDAIAAWQSRGYRIAIDHFGRDFSPEQDAAALRLRPDLIKIDRGVLRHCNAQPRAIDALYGRIAQAREAGVRVVAVGVESARHMALAQRLQADYAQGHYCGKPQPYCISADAALEN